MVTINQDGLVPVAPVHPRVMATFEKVKQFQLAVDNCTGALADRKALFSQLEGWLHDLKALTLLAFEYREQHDFLNKVDNPFDESDTCPPGATPEQEFQYENNLVLTAMRVKMEMFHIYTSTLLDRVTRIFGEYFVGSKAINAKSHEAFWKQVKNRPDITYLPSALRTEANWLQNNVDWYRNRVIVHPEGFEKEGFHVKGLKSKAKENIRMFIRARVVDADGNVTEEDRASETLEVIIDHLCRYIEGVIDILDANHADSILEDQARPRPERI